MIRILHLITDLDLGGAEKLLVEMARHRDREQFALSVAFLRGGGALRGALDRLGVRVSNLSGGALRAVRGLLAREPVDILHTHLIRADFVGGAIARSRNAPAWITTKHNTHYFRGLRVPYGWLDRRVNRRAAAVVAVSEAVREHYMKTEGMSRERIELIRNGITPATGLEARPIRPREAVRASLGIAPEEAILIHVGSLTRQKGQAVLLRAIPKISAVGRPVRVLLVGGGPNRPALARMTERLGLEERVKLLGLRDDLPALLGASDLFVFPSRWEGLGLALLEAMEAGLPVVASRVGGIPEVVEDGTTGLLVPACDPEALAAAVGRLLGDPERAGAMGKAGRERVRELFSADAMARSYEQLYRKVMTGNA